ncbi:MAG: hypothetical protein Q7T37_00700 [bacterium]|nr:hypothetical protein [bacterium]MDO8741936.1 hypothetical protein [bacterium]
MEEIFLIRAVRYLSRGKITASKDAIVVLAGIAILLIAISFLIFVSTGQSDVPKDQIGIKSHDRPI